MHKLRLNILYSYKTFCLFKSNCCIFLFLSGMKKSFIVLWLSSLIVSEHAFAQRHTATQIYYENYSITSSLKKDSLFIKMLKPYKDSMSKTMEKVIGFAIVTLNRKQPEGTLGNFLADVLKIMAERKFNRKVDAAFMNPGGIRSYIAKGNITIGRIFEVMPFDNLLVLQEVKGATLKQFLHHTASKKGWPVSGLSMVINNNTADSIVMTGKPLDENAVYTIALPDYVANGGDDTGMLRGIPIINKGYLVRECIIEYIQELTSKGRAVSAEIENRVRNAGQ